MVSSTGWMSVGELEITRRICAVAVCWVRVSARSRLRASSSWKRRTSSIAITAWSAKVWSSSTCRSEKGAAAPWKTTIAPMASPARSIGTARALRKPVARAVSVKSWSGSASMSGMWTVARVSTARAAAVARPGGSG